MTGDICLVSYGNTADYLLSSIDVALLEEGMKQMAGMAAEPLMKKIVNYFAAVLPKEQKRVEIMAA